MSGTHSASTASAASTPAQQPVQTDFFYRRLRGSPFIHDNSAAHLPVVPVRLKNEFTPHDLRYDESTRQWQPAEISNDAVQPQGAEAAGAALFCEYVAYQETFRPFLSLHDYAEHIDCIERGDSGFEVEELDDAELDAFISYRKSVRRNEQIKAYLTDANGISKDIFACTVSTDRARLQLSITLHLFCKHTEPEGSTDPDADQPDIKTQAIRFDMKNGTVTVEGCGERGDEFNELAAWDSQKQREYYWRAQDFLENHTCIPSAPLRFAWTRLRALARAYTGAALNGPVPQHSELPLAMYCLTMLPLEPRLYPVLCTTLLRSRKFAIDRTDSRIFLRFCRTFRIHDCPTVRRAFNDRPASLFTYIRIKAAGFRDINLYRRVLQNSRTSYLFDEFEKKDLVFFVRWSIELRGEVCTMNTLLKDGQTNILMRNDAMEMFRRYFPHIPQTLKKEILHEGFTERIHDALASLSYRMKHKNVRFAYSAAQLALQDSIDGYEFRLPADSSELCEIGIELHNCVATYIERIAQHKCTVIYAQTGGRRRLCIEVRGNEIYQERADHNTKPDGTENAVLARWQERHRLHLLGA